jgi:hypothetical protein
MPTLRIIWDVLFRGEFVTQKGTDVKVAEAMDSHCSDHSIEAVLRWNTVLEGQKVARTGFTSGLRYLVPVDHISTKDIQTLLDSLQSFTHEYCETSACMISESLDFPLNRSAKARFPVLGRIALMSRFTHGLGCSTLTQIKSAKANQTKDTKNGLDPIRMGKGSSGELFSKNIGKLMSDSLWFLVLTTSTAEGYQTPSKALSGGSDGGMYQLSFDLRGAISKLVDKSNPEWWEPLDPDDLNLNPQLIVNPTKELENTFDPATFHHHDSKAQDIIDKVLKIEMKQTGDEIMRDDLEYTLQRLQRKKRVPRQLTGNDHGLVPGLEKHLISEHFMKPWLAEEFFNCLAFFLMTRKPNYWRNGKSEILLLHSLEDLNLDDLKDQ